MKKADCFFVVRVCERWTVRGCAEKHMQEARGLYGFHDFTRCPKCEVRFAGWEFWGENGHKQGSAETREMLAHWLRYQARRQWLMKDGRTMGYRFRVGGRQYVRV